MCNEIQMNRSSDDQTSISSSADDLFRNYWLESTVTIQLVQVFPWVKVIFDQDWVSLKEEGNVRNLLRMSNGTLAFVTLCRHACSLEQELSRTRIIMTKLKNWTIVVKNTRYISIFLSWCCTYKFWLEIENIFTEALLILLHYDPRLPVP